MGCDIHMHTEKRVDGAWQYVASGPYEDRDYDLFWVLGSIHRRPGKIAPLACDRGAPEDMSPETRRDLESWDSDAHSASWLTLAELETYSGPRDKSRFWTRDLSKLHEVGRAEDVRIVFWFDN